MSGSVDFDLPDPAGPYIVHYHAAGLCKDDVPSVTTSREQQPVVVAAMAWHLDADMVPALPPPQRAAAIALQHLEVHEEVAQLRRHER